MGLPAGASAGELLVLARRAGAAGAALVQRLQCIKQITD